jgi:YHS domain-containing protein
MSIAIDPVCGMEVQTDTAEQTAQHEGTTYYFCGKGCRLDFEEDPARFLAPDYQPSM